MENMRSVVGKLGKVIFYNEQSSFLIGAFKDVHSKKNFTAKGVMPSPAEGSLYRLSGKDVVHKKYGRQFEFSYCELSLENDSRALVDFLEKAGDISESQAEDLYSLFGDGIISILYDYPSRIRKARFLSEEEQGRVVKNIHNYIQNQRFIEELVRFGLRVNHIELLKQKYPNDLERILKNDPYHPYFNVSGFGRDTSTKIADGLGLANDDIRRMRALVYYRLLDILNGDTWISKKHLYDNLRALDYQLFEDALESLEDMNRIVIEDGRIYPTYLYRAENTIARRAARLMEQEDLWVPASLDDDIAAFERRQSAKGRTMKLDEKQKDAIRLFFEKPFMILNGGPGTGKSTVINAILELMKKHMPYSVPILCAPTGKAAKRMEEVTKHEARTIHSILHWNPEDNSFGHNSSKPLGCNVLIVDEASMIDARVFSALLDAVVDHCHVLIVGDENQLESVASGRVLNDMVESGLIPMVSLSHVFRSKDGSSIPFLAKQIRENEELEMGDDIETVQVPDGDITEWLKGFITPDMQMLAPMYAKRGGVDEINRMAQEKFNPPAFDKFEYQLRNGVIFREGDRVMLKKNITIEKSKDNKIRLCNGDVGTIISVSPHDRIVTVLFDKTEVDFEENHGEFLIHAWCLTVHKSQGSEYDKVICIFPSISRHMLKKRLLYTAVSRAKKHLIIAGSVKAFKEGVKDTDERIRQTSLKERLIEQFGLMEERKSHKRNNPFEEIFGDDPFGLDDELIF